MEYRHAAIPAVAGGLMLTLLLWWAGASADALDLDGAAGALGIETANALRSWLNPWAYDPRPGASVAVTADGASYVALHDTAMQIRFVAVFLFYAAGALLLVRRLPAERGRAWQALLALWAWGVVAGTLAVTVSAPWMIASGGRGSYRFLPQLAALASTGRTVLVPLALAASVWTVFVTRLALKNAEPQPRGDVPARTAVVAATIGTAVVAVSVVVLSYQANAARIQTTFTGGGSSPSRVICCGSGCCWAPGPVRRGSGCGTGCWCGSGTCCCSRWCGARCGGCRGCSPGCRSRRWRCARCAPLSWDRWCGTCGA